MSPPPVYGDLPLGGRYAPRPSDSLAFSEPRELLVVNSLAVAYEPDGALAKDTVRGITEGNLPLDLAPDRLDGEEVVRVHEEEVVWAGPIAAPERSLISPFAHFMLESVARLWPLLRGAELEGLPVVFTKPADASYAAEWLGGFGAPVIELPKRGAVRFRRMIVPEPACRWTAWLSPAIRAIHLQARGGLELPAHPHRDTVWLSRLGGSPDRVPQGEGVLESRLTDRVAVARPKLMTLAEQVATLEASRAVAGVLGSSFHALLMAIDPPDCLYLCPPWERGDVSAQHRLLDGSATFVRALELAESIPRSRREGIRFPQGYRLLVDESMRALEETVLAPPTARGPRKGPNGKLRLGERHHLLPRRSLAISKPRELLVLRSVPSAYEPDGSVAIDTRRAIGERSVRLDIVPKRMPNEEVVRTYDEETVWGGNVAPHYGHFLVESVTRLWPLVPGAELEGLPVVLTTPREAPYVQEWLAAFGARLVELPKRGIVRFKRMLVPEPAWQIGGWIAPELRDLHLHARRGMPKPAVPRHDLLWLTRSTLEGGRMPYDEALLEWLLGDRIASVGLERMTLPEQVATLEGSRAVAGVFGSAFHTLPMVADSPDCLYLCPPWEKGEYVAQQWLMDADATFAHALEIMPWGSRSRQGWISFPQGYRLLVPEALRALGETVLPDLLDDPRLAAFADPASEGGASGSPLDAAVATVLRDPLSIEARRRLAAAFESEGLSRCAQEQLAMASDLSCDVTAQR